MTWDEAAPTHSVEAANRAVWSQDVRRIGFGVPGENLACVGVAASFAPRFGGGENDFYSLTETGERLSEIVKGLVR